MSKSKTNLSPILLAILALFWFIVISYITAETEYSRILADRLADPQGTSTQLEGILDVLVVIVSFIPSGLLLAYPYVMKHFKTYKILRVIALSAIISLSLYVLFGWYNFAVNFVR